MLSEKAMGRKLTNYDRSIDMHVSKLRRKLDPDSKDKTIIKTIRGMGYQFTGG
jgi:two-component system response regulator CpxR